MTPPLPADRPALLIDLDAIRRNHAMARAAFTGRSLGAVVKKDAYGLGLSRVAPLLHDLGCRDFWVADLDEAADLRRVLPGGRIFVLHGLSQYEMEDFRHIDAIPVLTTAEEVARASLGARGERAKVALHLDTGLNRLGLGLREVRGLLDDPIALDRFSITAYVTMLAHFADLQSRSNYWQWRRFCAWSRRLPPAPLSFCASAGVFGPPERHMDMARVGSALYGVETTPTHPQPITPAATLSAPIVRVHDLPSGAEVGYGGAYHTSRPCRLAHVAVGYAAGIPFTFHRTAHVLLAGHAVPIVATPSMSLLTIDVTDLPPHLAQPGCRVTIFGPELPVHVFASAARVPPNLVMVAAGRGVRRVYCDSRAAPLERACIAGGVRDI